MELIDLVNSVVILISNDLTHMVNFPLGSLIVTLKSPALLGLFLSSEASVCSTKTFPSIGKFWSCGCLIFHRFSVKLKTGCPISLKAYDYSRADWDGLCDHLRDVPWEDILKFGASTATSDFCEWFQVRNLSS